MNPEPGSNAPMPYKERARLFNGLMGISQDQTEPPASRKKTPACGATAKKLPGPPPKNNGHQGHGVSLKNVSPQLSAVKALKPTPRTNA